MTPEWRDIPGYEGYYQASDDGQIRSVPRVVSFNQGPYFRRRRTAGVVLRARESKVGYLTISLYRDGHQASHLVHRLVLRAFVGEPPAGMECCHGNGDRTDNRLENLRWGTKSENQLDIIRHGKNARLRRTHCPQGHPYSGDNLRIRRRANGRLQRRCRSCMKVEQRTQYLRRRRQLKAAS